MRFALAACVLLAGCRTTTTTSPDGSMPASPVLGSPAPPPAHRNAWDGTGEFEFYYTDFHFELGGTQVIAIGKDGGVHDLFVRHALETVDAFCKDAGAERKEICADLRKHGEKEIGTSSWFLAKYTLSEAEQTELRARLGRARLADLDPRYEQKGLEDGTSNTYRLASAAGSTEVSVYTSNGENVPAALRPVIQFLRGLETTHEADRKQAPEATPAEQKELLRVARGT